MFGLPDVIERFQKIFLMMWIFWYFPGLLVVTMRKSRYWKSEESESAKELRYEKRTEKMNNWIDKKVKVEKIGIERKWK